MESKADMPVLAPCVVIGACVFGAFFEKANEMRIANVRKTAKKHHPGALA